MCPPPRSVQVCNSLAGGFSLTSRVARSTSRYSSSMPTVNGGSVLLTQTPDFAPFGLILYDQTGYRCRRGEIESLGEVHADALKLFQHCLAFDTLGHGRDTQRPSHLADGLDHASVNCILGNVADELPVDFEEVHRQGLGIK